MITRYKGFDINLENDDEINRRKAIIDAYCYFKDMYDDICKDNIKKEEYKEYLKRIFASCCVNNFEKVTIRSRLFCPMCVDNGEIINYINNPKDKDFQGYNKEKSFINLANPQHPNRMNEKGERCLYTASDVRTSIFEVDPSIDSYVSVAAIKCIKPLKIADLSKSESIDGDDFLRNLSLYVQENLKLGNCDADYIFPRFVASVCRELGYDGLAYRSRFDANRISTRHSKGIDYAIFSYKKCEATSSRVYKIQYICSDCINMQDKNPDLDSLF